MVHNGTAIAKLKYNFTHKTLCKDAPELHHSVNYPNKLWPLLLAYSSISSQLFRIHFLQDIVTQCSSRDIACFSHRAKLTPCERPQSLLLTALLFFSLLLHVSLMDPRGVNYIKVSFITSQTTQNCHHKLVDSKYTLYKKTQFLILMFCWPCISV